MRSETFILLLIVTPFIIAITFATGGFVWFHTLPKSEQERLTLESIDNQCNETLKIYANTGAFLGKSDRPNGTFSPISNTSKICYFPLEPQYTITTKVVTIAGFENDWLRGDCTIVTKQNEFYSTWKHDPCIKLTPGNTVEITLGMVEGYEKFGTRIFDAKIL